MRQLDKQLGTKWRYVITAFRRDVCADTENKKRAAGFASRAYEWKLFRDD